MSGYRFMGEIGLSYGDNPLRGKGYYQYMFIGEIGGGTSQIQKILSASGFGMPKSPMPSSQNSAKVG